MAWPLKCRFLAAALAVASLLVEVRAQLQQILPASTPGVNSANAAIAADAAGITECSCDCCQATQRTTQIAGESMSCAVVPAIDGGSCPVECKNPDRGAVVTSADGPLQYERFCHFNCLPEIEEVGKTCRKLTEEEHDELQTGGGNGQDPATLSSPNPPSLPAQLVDPDAPPEPPQLVDQQALSDAANQASSSAAGAAEDAAGVEKDKEEDKDTGAMVAESSGNQAIAASMEARLTEAEASSAQSVSLSNGDMESAKSSALMVNAAREQVKAAEVRATIYAKSAAKAAARAQAELKDIQEIPQRAAEFAAAEAKKVVQAEVNQAASNVAIVKARLAGPGLPVPLAEAAVRAAQPYYNVMNKAIAMGNLYAQSAYNLQDQAQTMQQQSRELASQAVLYQTAGYGDMAQKLMAQAKSLLNQATAKDAQAKKDFSVAEGVRKSVPNYQANAALASARATSIANPGGQPPPAMAPKFLQLSSHAKV